MEKSNSFFASQFVAIKTSAKLHEYSIPRTFDWNRAP